MKKVLVEKVFRKIQDKSQESCSSEESFGEEVESSSDSIKTDSEADNSSIFGSDAKSKDDSS
jgi:hypothetical protein